jgi:hypothetical protein
VRTNDGSVSVLVLQDQWNKLKTMVAELQEMVAARPEGLDRKRVEQIWGFVIYVVQTYPTMKPYLIGLHMTIDGWRSNRDAKGWRLSNSVSDSVMVKEEDGNWISVTPDMEVPVLVKEVPRSASDLEALAKLCGAKTDH